MRDGCPFCDYEGPSEIRFERNGVYFIEPINPVVPGHILAIPRQHVEHALEDEDVTGRVFAEAAWYVGAHEQVNLITSVGEAATQTVRHLHVHIVPRAVGDGLLLPWSSPAEAPTADITTLPPPCDDLSYAQGCRCAKCSERERLRNEQHATEAPQALDIGTAPGQFPGPGLVGVEQSLRQAAEPLNPDHFDSPIGREGSDDAPQSAVVKARVFRCHKCGFDPVAGADCSKPCSQCGGVYVIDGNECGSCIEGFPRGECPKSKRWCRHHCNHILTHDSCDWCGGRYEEEESIPAETP